jgi:DNA-binding beta-propeller fold protein YncE
MTAAANKHGALLGILSLVLLLLPACGGSRDKNGDGTTDGGPDTDAAAEWTDAWPDGWNDGQDWDAPPDASREDIPLPDVVDETVAGMGPGTGNEYHPGPENSNGVGTNEDGWLILETERIENNNLWVANSGEGTVSKIDVDTDTEVGRFYTGLDDRNADPSRTSVDLAGDVFAGNRAHNYPADTEFRSSVTKISAHTSRCVDRDGDTVIETSTGSTAIPRNDGSDPHVPVGQSTDECVVWTRDLSVEPNGCLGLRAVAATDETGLDFEVNGHVWAGCWKSNAIYKLHGNTGDVLASYVLPTCAPYGFVLDDVDRLWVSCRDAWHDTDPRYASIAWIDTTTGEEHVIPPITETYPSGSNDPNPYGIAINASNQVIITTYDGRLLQYDEATGWSESPDTMTSPTRGVAVDEDGWIYAMSTGSSDVYLFDPATLSILEHWNASDGVNPTDSGNGVAIDFSGDLWGITMNTAGPNGWATHFSLDRSGAHPVVTDTVMVPVGLYPYTYSDMIGYSLRHFTTREGWYNHVFEACPGHSVHWIEISWEAIVPAGTSIVIRARTADYLDDLAAAAWVTLVEVPDDVSPVPIPDTLPEGHYIELEVRLYTTVDERSPEVGAITFDWDCTSPII